MNSDITFAGNSISPFQIIKNAILNTNKHFTGLISYISFSLLIVICMFVPLWVWYIKMLGLEHFIVTVFEMNMNFSFFVVIIFMISIFLFNKTHPNSQKLTFWKFTKDVSWPWLVEGLKASVITIGALFLFIIPGIIKSVHYTFFSFVVFFNQDYKEGKINALKHSKMLSKDLGWWIFFLTFIIPVCIVFISERVVELVFQQTNSLWILYPVLIFYLYITCILFTYSYSVLYFMYTAKEQNQIY